MNVSKYYLTTLGKDESDVYYRFESGIVSFRNKIDLPCDIPHGRIFEIFRMVKLDSPELFYCNGISLKGGSRGLTAIPEYGFDAKNAEKQLSSFEKKAERILNGTEDYSEIEKEGYIHDWLVENTTYTSLYKNYSHEIYGVFNNGIGVCEGIAKTAKYLFDRCGIDSAVVVSKPDEKNISHAWNVVLIDGRYYHLDVTFDLSQPEWKKRKYFNLTDAEIFRDHRETLFPIPRCSEN